MIVSISSLSITRECDIKILKTSTTNPHVHAFSEIHIVTFPAQGVLLWLFVLVNTRLIGIPLFWKLEAN